MAKVPSMVDVYWLRVKLIFGLQGIRVVDASWDLSSGSAGGKEEFNKTRIESARFFDIDEVCDKTSPYDHMLPTPQQFQDYVGQMGISNSHHVVVYDNNSKYGLFSAPRVWWMFKVFGHDRVSVMDGGMPMWKGCLYPLQKGPPPEKPHPPEQFTANYNEDLVYNLQQVTEALGTGSPQVVDARSAGRFSGRDPEPRPSFPSGHMVGAKSVPFMSLLDPEYNVFKNNDQLREVFTEAGVDLSQPMVTTCGSGITAAIVSLAAHVLNQQTPPPLYDGSWVEWVQAAPPSSRTTSASSTK